MTARSIKLSLVRQAGLLALVFLCQTKAFSATYYVAQSGSDTNPGTQASPWKTCPGMGSRSYSTLAAGDKVYFNRADTWSLPAGEYGLHVKAGVTYIGDEWGTGTGKATLRSSGALETAIIDIREDHPTLPTIVKGFDCDGNMQYGSGVGINHPRFSGPLTGALKRVQNLHVHNTWSSIANDKFFYGIIMRATYYNGTQYPVSNVEVLDCQVNHISRDGIALYPDDGNATTLLSSVTVRGCDVSDLATDPVYADHNSYWGGLGITVKGQVRDVVIENNFVHDTNAVGIAVVGNQNLHYGVGSSNIHIRNNIITNNGTGAIRLADNPSGGDPKEVKVYGNLVYNSPYAGVALVGDTRAAVTLRVYNNTFYNAPANIPATSNISLFEFKNNIIYMTSGQAIIGGSAATMSNNLTTNPSFKNTASLPTGFTGTYGVDLAPNTDGFSLNSGSPAIDAGTTFASPYNTSINSVTRPTGNFFDIGAYEFGSAAQPVQPTISGQPGNTTVTAGNAASFIVTAAGGSLSYQWQRQEASGTTWSNVGANLSNYSFTTTSVAADNGAKFRVMISNSAGSVTSNVATLTVNTAPPPPPPPSGVPWAGLLSPTRAADWRNAGVVGGIPSENWPFCDQVSGSGQAACQTLYGGNVTASTILAAINGAPANSVVRIPRGTFNISSGLDIRRSDVAIRGAGSSGTILKMNGNTGANGISPTIGTNRAISLWSGAAGTGKNGGFSFAGWSSGYAQGSTQITLDNTTGIIAGPVGTGTLLFLDQNNDATDGYPQQGDLFVCENTGTCSNQGGNEWARPGRAQVQVVTVTGKSGNTLTISPPMVMPNIRTDRTPGAYWMSGSPVHNTGFEDLTIDFTGANSSGLFIVNAANCWVTRTRFIITTPGSSETYHIFALQSAHLSITSNYFYGRPDQSLGGGFPTSNYAYIDNEVSDVVYENNINHSNVGTVVPNDPATENVYAYNYTAQTALGIGGAQLHSGAMMMALFEGNNWGSFLGDIIHGPHYLLTLYRNHFDGSASNPNAKYGICLNTHNRLFNLVGNVLGSNDWSVYQPTFAQINSRITITDDSVYVLGWTGTGSGAVLPDDPDVARTTMRWANWDSVSNATQKLASEVPSDSSRAYSNIVPDVNLDLPDSLYLTGQPRWWTPGADATWSAAPFPPIGPDVSGGNITATPTGGHANKIPARLCYEDLKNDPAYSATPAVKIFFSTRCYVNAGPTAPPPNTAPAITSNPSATTVMVGVSASFGVGASGYPLNYEWQRQEAAGTTWSIVGGNSAGYTTGATVVATDNGAKFRCRVYNNLGSVLSGVATLSVSNGKFNIGDRVIANNVVAARPSPGVNQTNLYNHALGELGTVVAGPQTADGYTWWQINYDLNSDGWSTEERLDKYNAPVNGPHPADTDPVGGDFKLTQNEVTKYGSCWRSAPVIPAGCEAGANVDYATRAGLLYITGPEGAYHFDSNQSTCPSCWQPGP